MPADRSLRSVLQEASIPVPFSCQEGYCGSCETRVLEGVPDHRDLILNETEKAENQTMMVVSLDAPFLLALYWISNAASTCHVQFSTPPPST